MYNILIPWFDNLKFNSKKYKDYLDFKLITTLIYQGKHLTAEGKDLIHNITNRMNDNRLSTNPNILLPRISEGEINSILNRPPLIEVDSVEGRARIISSNKIIRSIYIIAAYFVEPGYTIYFHNGVYCSKYLRISYNVMVRRLNDSKPFLTNYGLVKLSRKPIFITKRLGDGGAD